MGVRTPEERAVALDQLQALQMAALARQLPFVVEADVAEDWSVDGCSSMAEWLAYRYHLAPARARELVRVAHALAELPAIAAAAGAGELSWDQLRVLVRFATPERDAELAEAAPGWSVAQLEALARSRVSREEAEERMRGRFLRFRPDLQAGTMRLYGRLPDAEGRLVADTIHKLADALQDDRPPCDEDSYEARCADALVAAVAGGEGLAAPATVVVHVEEAVLQGSAGVAALDDGTGVSSETAQRLACDGRLHYVVHDEQGRTVGIGRSSRRVPPKLALDILHRDGRRCRWPGCPNCRWLQLHHLTPVCEGGPTNSSNLATFCGSHHRLVHEGGWRIEGHPDGTLRFVSPDGRVLRTRRQGLRPEIRDRFFGPDPPDTS